MIVEGLIDFGIYVIQLAFSSFEAISLPVDTVIVLLDIMQFGAWVIGADLFGFIIGNIFAWLSFKFVGGLVLFLYRLIPLT